MQDRPSRSAEVLTALERRLVATVEGSCSIEDCTRWAQELPRSSVDALRERPDERNLSALDALDVMRCQRDWDPPLEAGDAATWLSYLRGPRPPRCPSRWLAGRAGDPVEFARQRGLDLVRFMMEGLGGCRAVMFQSDPPEFWFSCWWGEAQPPKSVALEFRPDGDPTRAAAALFERLALDEDDFDVLSPDVDLSRLPEWTLLRTDDNGNCVAVSTSRSRAKVSALGAKLESSGHRQLYEVVRR